MTERSLIRLSNVITKLIQNYESEDKDSIRKTNLETQLRGCFQNKDFIYCLNCGKLVPKDSSQRVDYFCNENCYGLYQKKKWWL